MGHVTITLNSRTYRLRCGDGEEPRLLELANHLHQRIDGLSREFGQVGDDRLLVMAALLATDELLDAKAALAERVQGAGLPGEPAQPPLPIPPVAPSSLSPPRAGAPPALPWEQPVAATDGAPVDSTPPAPQRPAARAPQRASLNDRLAEVRDATASEKRAG